METAVGVLVGALITWFASRYYYKKAGEDLTREAAQLRELNIVTLKYLEKAGVVKVRWDENLEPLDIDIFAPKVTVDTPKGGQVFYLKDDEK
jgi:uncharacterized membrane protein (Fun14 family)